MKYHVNWRLDIAWRNLSMQPALMKCKTTCQLLYKSQFDPGPGENSQLGILLSLLNSPILTKQHSKKSMLLGEWEVRDVNIGAFGQQGEASSMTPSLYSINFVNYSYYTAAGTLSW